MHIHNSVIVHGHETSSLIGSVKLIWSDRQLQYEELRQLTFLTKYYEEDYLRITNCS
jgi:hypothetical protein